MFERFTVDVLSGQVATLLMEGEPTPRLTYRFFRKGRRDGRRAFDHDSVAKMLEDSVHLAGSTLVEQLVSARAATELQIHQLQARIAASEADALPPRDDVAMARSQDTADAGSTQLLREALESRRRLIQDRARAQRAAEAQAAEVELAQLRRRLDVLPGEFAQRFESIRHTGELLWARYCNGFVQGESRRGSRSSDVDLPVGSLRIEVPRPLRDAVSSTTTAGAAQRATTTHPEV